MKHLKSLRLTPVLFIMLSFFTVLSTAQARIFLEIAGIPGDSEFSQYDNMISVDSVSTGFQLDGCGEISVSKSLDKSSIRLIASAVTGIIHPVATLYFVELGDGTGSEKPMTYMSIAMKNVLVSSISSSGDANDRPTEQVQLVADSLEINYEDVSQQVVCIDKIFKNK